jgi:hypothetical protein
MACKCQCWLVGSTIPKYILWSTLGTIVGLSLALDWAKIVANVNRQCFDNVATLCLVIADEERTWT